MRKRFPNLSIVLILLAVLVFSSTATVQAEVYPEVIELPVGWEPTGWMPEGIAVGEGHTFYSGSRANGAIYRGDLLTGDGEIIYAGETGRMAVGLKYVEDCDLLVVAGGSTGKAYLYDGGTGAPLQTYTFATAPTFVNDVVVTEDAFYFTDSFQPVLYRVDLIDCAAQPVAHVIPLSGDYQHVAGAFNVNGIVAHPSGKSLIVVNSTKGSLYKVDPVTGHSTFIDLGGASVPAGDGLALRGNTLYVVQNRLNQIAVISLNSDWTAGEVVDTLTSKYFDVPTTIAFFGNALYAINGRFSTPPTPTTVYTVVRVELH